tara:strand:- start:152 stop:400 length:249 start_codon:yes stop_codon:yes gene_type:complete
MYAPTAKNKRSRTGRDDYGKCLCLSIPFHELHLIEDMDKLTHVEMCASRSEYIRKLIRREKIKLNDQERMVQTNWSTIWGQK